MPTSGFEAAAEPAGVPLLRSVLFVGGCALPALPEALASGADAVCIDLEDAVPPERKAQARADVLAALAALAPREPRDTAAPCLLVRINSLRTMDGIADLHALLSIDSGVTALVLPKVESGDELRWADALANDAGRAMRYVCIIETTDGLAHSRAIAGASRRLMALFFGGFDMSTALGAEMAWEPLLYARSRAVHAAAGAGVQILDSPFPGLDDLDGLRSAAAQARALGMTGKAAKHARQVPAINAAFSHDDAAIAHARAVVQAFEQDPTRPLVIDGKLIELPAIKRLQRVARLRPG